MVTHRSPAVRGKPAALVVVAVLILGLGLVIVWTVSRDGHSGSAAPAPSISRTSHSAGTASSTAPATRTPSAANRAALTKAIKTAGGGGTVSVAALNLATGAHVEGGSTHGQWIASAYKLLLVEALLLKEDGNLSSGERSDAALALEHSDNPAGYRLYLDLGGQSGMVTQLRRLGVKHFSPGSFDPTLSTTSASDLVQVLRALVDPTPLSASSRDFVLDLLRHVESDQRWGVGAASTGDSFVNKNGWLSIGDDNPAGETDNGLWAVNSMGIVVVHGQRVLMAVMTQHNDDYDGGVKRVEALAKLTAAAVAY